MALSLLGEAAAKDRERMRAHYPALVLESDRKRPALSIPSFSSTVVDSQMNRKMPRRLVYSAPAPLAFEISGIDLAHHHLRLHRHVPIWPPLSIKLFTQLRSVILHATPAQPCTHPHPHPAPQLRRCWPIILPGGRFQRPFFHARREQSRRFGPEQPA